jgi:hypothetical protein
MKLLLPLFKIKNGIPQEESKWSARFFISAETALGTVQPFHEKKIKIPKELTRAMVSVKVRQTHRPQQKTAIDIFTIKVKTGVRCHTFSFRFYP